jgi:cell division protein FtsW (lipid II flippase)
MKLNTFMMIAAILALLFGVGFIVAPASSLQLYGTTTDLTGEFLARYLGAALIGLAFVIWLTRNAAPSETRKGLLTGLFVTMFLGLVVALYDKFAGAGNALIWLNVVIYLLLAIGFGYFAFMKND